MKFLYAPNEKTPRWWGTAWLTWNRGYVMLPVPLCFVVRAVLWFYWGVAVRWLRHGYVKRLEFRVRVLEAPK